MKPPPTKPKARVMWINDEDFSKLVEIQHMLSSSKWYKDDYPVAVIPCRTQREARALVRLHRMTPEERTAAVEVLFIKANYEAYRRTRTGKCSVSKPSEDRANAVAALKALGLHP